MNIKTITYSHTKNLGNYSSEKLEVSAELDDKEDAIEAVNQLRQFVRDRLYPPPKPEIPSDF